jgi:predicted small lipoprotein YifL
MARTTLVAIAALIALTACGNKGESEPENKELPPEQTLEALFAAAKANTPAAIAKLCDPQGENDVDTQKLCDMKPGKEWDDLRGLMSTGAVTGEAAINGDTATVPFKFGPVRGYKENMQLIRRDGVWYFLKM